MNKQELINVPRILFPIGTEILIKGKIVGLKVLDDRFVENVVKLDYGEQIIAPNDAIYVKDEPEPVKVPQCVHKYIQEAKEYNWDLQDLMKSIDDEDSKDLQRWFYHECNQETLARAWLDGYEIEKEKRYRISMPKTRNYMNNAQFLCEKDGKIFWCGEWHPFRTKFTRKELEEANFGWVFNCEGVEIEEVE